MDWQAQNVCQNLGPELAAPAAADQTQRLNARGLLAQAVENLAQPQRHAFQHRPGQLRAAVGHRQPDKSAARLWVPPRAALAHQIGQKNQAVRSWFDRSGCCVQIAAVQQLPGPLTSTAGQLHHPHRGIPLRVHMVKGHRALLRVWRRCQRAHADPGRSPDHTVGRARFDHPSPYPGTRAISTTGHHRRACYQPERRCHRCCDLANHAGRGIDPRQLIDSDPQRFQKRRMPAARHQVKQQRPRRVGVICGKDAGQPVHQIIFGHQKFCGAGIDLRLMVAYP